MGDLGFQCFWIADLLPGKRVTVCKALSRHLQADNLSGQIRISDPARLSDYRGHEWTVLVVTENRYDHVIQASVTPFAFHEIMALLDQSGRA